MRRRKENLLPDSLELLLDTMCNTFGGIMFIAISLIIISQFMSKLLLATSPEEIDRKNIKSMEQQIVQINQNIEDLKKQELDQVFQHNLINPEIKPVLTEINRVELENFKIQNNLNAVEAKIKVAEQLLKKLTEENEALSFLVAMKKKSVAANRVNANERHKAEVAAISELELKLKNLHPRLVRFAIEETTRLKPYWVLLENNRIFRLGSDDHSLDGEVSQQKSNFGRKVRLIPVRGTSLSENPATELDFLFRNLDRNQIFVSLVVGKSSFEALLVTRQYLRSKGYKANWMYNPEFEFYYSDNITYRASD